MRCDTWVGMLLWWSCQSPFTHSCGHLNHPNRFRGWKFKLSAKFDADFLALLAQSFWMWGPHNRVYHPPLTGTVKSSLFTHMHASPPSLAARLHQCCTNHSNYINNGWTFLDRPCIFFLWFESYFPICMPYDRSIVQNWIFESNKEGTVDIMFSFSFRVRWFCYCFCCFDCHRLYLCQWSDWGINLMSSWVFSEPVPLTGQWSPFLIFLIYAVAFECPHF